MANVLPQPTSTGRVVAGKNLFLYVNYGQDATEASPVWTLIGGQRSTSVERTAEEIDASHKTSGGWRVTLTGLRGWKFSSEAVCLIGDAGVDGIEEAFNNGILAQFRLVTKDDSGNIIKAQKGWGRITSFSQNGSYDDVCTASIEISGSEELVTEVNLINPESKNFSKAAAADVTFTMSLATGVSVTGVKNGNSSLTLNTDYNVSGGTLTIKDDYLSDLTNGTIHLAIATSSLNSMDVTIVVGA